MPLTWEAVLKQQLGQNQDLEDSTIVSCGDLPLPLPALIAQSLNDPHDSTFFDSFAVQHDSSSVDATVNVWSLSQESQNHRLSLETAMKKNKFTSCLFVIVLDLSKPWSVLSCLEKWISQLDKIVDSLSSQGQSEKNRKMIDSQKTYVQQRYAGMNYQNDIDSTTEELPELPEGMLEVNMGIPLIVVGCNSEALYHPQAPILSQYKSNWLQMQLRKFCYRRGASLVFTPSETFETQESSSSSMPSNFVSSGLLLQQYLLHRLYPSAFRYLNDDFDFDPTRPDHSLMITSGQESTSQICSLVIGDLEPEVNVEKIFPCPSEYSKKSETSGTSADGVSLKEDDDGQWLEDIKSSLSSSAAKKAILSSPVAVKKKQVLPQTSKSTVLPLGKLDSKLEQVSSKSTRSTTASTSSSSNSQSKDEKVTKLKAKSQSSSGPPPPMPPPPSSVVTSRLRRNKTTDSKKSETKDFFDTLIS